MRVLLDGLMMVEGIEREVLERAIRMESLDRHRLPRDTLHEIPVNRRSSPLLRDGWRETYSRPPTRLHRLRLVNVDRRMPSWTRLSLPTCNPRRAISSPNPSLPKNLSLNTHSPTILSTLHSKIRWKSSLLASRTKHHCLRRFSTSRYNISWEARQSLSTENRGEGTLIRSC